MGKAQYRKDNQGDNDGRHRGVEHVADVLEQGRPAHRRSQDGGVGQGRDLVAEIGTRNDGTRRDGVAEALGLSNAQQGHADRGDGGPRTANHDRNDGANHAGRHKEEPRRNNLDAVIDQGGDDSAHGPGTRNGTNHEKDDDGGSHLADIVPDGVLEDLPRGFKQPNAQPDANACPCQQGHLAGSQDGVAAEDADIESQQYYQDHHRNQGNERLFHMVATAIRELYNLSITADKASSGKESACTRPISIFLIPFQANCFTCWAVG